MPLAPLSQKKITLLLILFVSIVVAMIFFFWQNNRTVTVQPTQTKRLVVLTTFFPLYDFTRNVGQDRIQVELLFAQTPEVSSFTPQDIAKLNQADMVIKNGIGFEPVLDDLIRSSDNKKITVIDTSRGLTISKDEAGTNPHVWLNPRYATIQVQNIRDALAVADPANADFYRHNAQEYIDKLANLDQEIATATASFEKRDFVSFHSAFTYFAERYNLHQVAVIEEFPGKEPSPQYLAHVMKIIKDSGMTAIFSEPQFSPKVVDTIAHDLDLQVRVLDPIETGNINTDSYISFMQKNLQTLAEVLR